MTRAWWWWWCGKEKKKNKYTEMSKYKFKNASTLTELIQIKPYPFWKDFGFRECCNNISFVCTVICCCCCFILKYDVAVLFHLTCIRIFEFFKPVDNCECAHFAENFICSATFYGQMKEGCEQTENCLAMHLHILTDNILNQNKMRWFFACRTTHKNRIKHENKINFRQFLCI